MRILVVEDDRSVRETLGIVLESYQYQVQLVDGASGAMAFLEKDWPDVMLLDLTLQGITGEELYQMIHDRFKKVPNTLVLSAVQQGEDRVSKMQGARFLAKPYTLDELVDMVKETASSAKAA